MYRKIREKFLEEKWNLGVLVCKLYELIRKKFNLVSGNVSKWYFLKFKYNN